MNLSKKEIKGWLVIRSSYLVGMMATFVLFVVAGGFVAVYPGKLISFWVFILFMMITYGVGLISFPEFVRCYKDFKEELSTKSITVYVKEGTGGIQLTKSYSKLSYRTKDRGIVNQFLEGVADKTVTFEYLSNSGLIVNVYISADRRVRESDPS
jgi:hypothetical protein